MIDRSCACPPRLLNVQYRSAVADAAARGIRPADPLADSLAEARRGAQRWHAWWQGRLPEVRHVEDHAVPGPVGPVPLRFFHDRRRRCQPLAIYFHGGGFVLNGAGTHERLLRDLAVRAQIAVCGVDYSLAPENRFPVQLDEAVASIRWIVRHANELGIDPDRLALGGDSAGANLALAAASRLRREEVPIRFLFLFYGMYAHDFDTPSHRQFGDGTFGLSTERMRWFWQQYLRDARDASDPGAVPLNADLRGLPPALVIGAGLDCLRDDSIRLAARLEAAGVPKVLSVYDDLPHGFAVLAPAVVRADDAVAEAADALAWLRRRRGYTGWAEGHRQRQTLHRRVAATLSGLADTPEDSAEAGAKGGKSRNARTVPLLAVRRRPEPDDRPQGTGAAR